MQSSNGLVIVYAHIRNPDIRDVLWQHLEDIPGERVTRTIYEFDTSDWDDGLFQSELDWIADLLEGTRETVIVWYFKGGEFTRFALSR